MISENFLEPNDGKALPWKDVRKASWSLVHVRPPTEQRLRRDLEKRRQPTSLAGKAFFFFFVLLPQGSVLGQAYTTERKKGDTVLQFCVLIG